MIDLRVREIFWQMKLSWKWAIYYDAGKCFSLSILSRGRCVPDLLYCLHWVELGSWPDFFVCGTLSAGQEIASSFRCFIVHPHCHVITSTSSNSARLVCFIIQSLSSSCSGPFPCFASWYKEQICVPISNTAFPLWNRRTILIQQSTCLCSPTTFALVSSFWTSIFI